MRNFRSPGPTKGSARLSRFVRRFAGKRIAVVGDFMLDRFVRGSVHRISPEGSVPVVEVNQPETVHLGGAGNVVANLVALGGRAAAFGIVGGDAAGRLIRAELKQLGAADSGLLTVHDRPTTMKVRILAEHQHVVRADWEKIGPLDPRTEQRLLSRFQRLCAARGLDGVVLSDYDKGVLSSTLLENLLAACARAALPVFVDLKRARRFESEPQAEIRLMLVNQRRAEEMAAVSIQDEKTLELVGRHLLARFPSRTLIITQGSRGMVVFEPASRGVRGGRRETDTFRCEPVHTKPWEVFDVTGAGDTVISTLTLALLAEASAVEAASLANNAAGIVVGKLGTAVCTAGELVASLKTNRRQP